MARIDSLFRPAVVAAGTLLVAGNVLSLGRPDKFSDAAKSSVFALSSAMLPVSGLVLLVALFAMSVDGVDHPDVGPGRRGCNRHAMTGPASTSPWSESNSTSPRRN